MTVSKQKNLILTHSEIEIKINRMAWQILEKNYNATQIIIIGIEQKGVIIGQLLSKELQKISKLSIVSGTIKLSKDSPSIDKIKLTCPADIENNAVILVDDVLNSGKTLMYGTLPILAQNPSTLQTAVLANRDHTNFPVKADFVGISLATTLQEHISFEQNKKGDMAVYLS
ncbi:MAG: phosphoribosyltransferase [Flavobacteriales bacterium]|nr:phosphoribosyltransferase [Flavobacteriales bacterium]